MVNNNEYDFSKVEAILKKVIDEFEKDNPCFGVVYNYDVDLNIVKVYIFLKGDLYDGTYRILKFDPVGFFESVTPERNLRNGLDARVWNVKEDS